MTINQAIRILDPDTSAEALGEIEYYGGLHGHEKMMAACEEACRMAVEILMKKAQNQYYSSRKEIFVPSEFVARGSCAPYRQ